MANNNRSNLRALHEKAQKAAQEQQLRAAALKSDGGTPAQKLMAGLGVGVDTTWDQTWKDVDALFTSMAEGVYTFATSVTETYGLLSQYQITPISADNAELTETSKAAQLCRNIVLAAVNDCEVFSTELSKIKESHNGKTGIVTKDDLVLYYSAGDQYNTLWQKFQTNSYQTTNELTTYLSDLMTAVNKESNLERVVEKTLIQHQSEKDAA